MSPNRQRIRPPEGYVKDTGLIVVLVVLLFAYGTGRGWLVLLAVAALLLVMTVPAVFKPLAVAWFFLTSFLGGAVNRVVLTLLFFVLLLPIALVRRMLGRDPMKRNEWKRGDGSVFTRRDHLYTADDMTVPY